MESNQFVKKAVNIYLGSAKKIGSKAGEKLGKTYLFNKAYSGDGKVPELYADEYDKFKLRKDKQREETEIKPKTQSNKIGGIMNYMQYMQQGGSIEDQVAGLVKAAMGGDQLATDQINKIMQAAQQGDQKAKQIAQMIQAMMLQMQEEETQEMQEGGSVAGMMRNGGSIQKFKHAGKIPAVKTDTKGIVTNGGTNPFWQAVVYQKPGTNLIDSVAYNYQDPEGYLLRHTTDFANSPKGEVPTTTLRAINEDGTMSAPDNQDWNLVTRRATTWEFPANWLVRGKSSNGLEIVPEKAKGGKVPCPCTLQKKGGKLVEVDCKGNVIKRSCGGKAKKVKK